LFWGNFIQFLFKVLNPQLIPICHFLPLLAAHPIFHVSSIKVIFSKYLIIKNKFSVYIKMCSFQVSPPFTGHEVPRGEKRYSAALFLELGTGRR
jgi:hypothetical protein